MWCQLLYHHHDVVASIKASVLPPLTDADRNPNGFYLSLRDSRQDWVDSIAKFYLAPLYHIRLPKPLLHAAFLAGYVRHSIYRVLGFLKELAEVVGWSDNGATSVPVVMVGEDQRRALRLEMFGVIREEMGDELINDDAVCAVCLSEFAMDDKVLLLTNCCHIYHEICLMKWLDHVQQQESCPLCRSPLMTD